MGWMRVGMAVGGLAVAAAAWRRLRPAGDVRGRIALVTGGSRGLGLLIARELGAAGCRVLLCARDADELGQAVQQLRDQGIDAHAFACDLRVSEDITAMADRAVTEFGGVDILVNNAGIITVGPLETVHSADVADAMQIMFHAPLQLSRELLPTLRERRGGIVNITSIGGKISAPHLLPYSCAKFAAAGLSEGLDVGLAGEGVRVTTVVPGLMRTGSHVQAEFSGAPRAEFTWFALGASLPAVSMDAERAAYRIVLAMRQGRRYLVLTPLARAAMIAHGLSPGSMQWILRMTDRMLPEPGREEDAGGVEARERTGGVLRFLTRLNDNASRRFNQIGKRRGAAMRGSDENERQDSIAGSGPPTGEPDAAQARAEEEEPDFAEEATPSATDPPNQWRELDDEDHEGPPTRA